MLISALAALLAQQLFQIRRPDIRPHIIFHDNHDGPSTRGRELPAFQGQLPPKEMGPCP
jgi:hypothetical protein